MIASLQGKFSTIAEKVVSLSKLKSKIYDLEQSIKEEKRNKLSFQKKNRDSLPKLVYAMTALSKEFNAKKYWWMRTQSTT